MGGREREREREREKERKGIRKPWSSPMPLLRPPLVLSVPPSRFFLLFLLRVWYFRV
jgi:hypothetical protein